jgi:UDP-glucose 4-epimerase
MENKILILGASGQIGTELTLKLRQIYGNSSVVASDIRNGNYEVMESGPFEIVDATDKKELMKVIQRHGIKESICWWPCSRQSLKRTHKRHGN